MSVNIFFFFIISIIIFIFVIQFGKKENWSEIKWHTVGENGLCLLGAADGIEECASVLHYYTLV